MWLLYGFLVLLAAVVGASAFFKQSAPQIRLEGKRVLVTGGSSGIGLVLAEMLLREGASVTIVARDKAKLAEAVKQLDKARRGTSQVIHSVSADVSDYPSISKAVDEAAAKMGGLDIYVGSAGNSRPGRFLDIPIEDFERQTKINYLGNVYTIRAAVPHMKKAGGGRVMIISSMAGLTGVAGFSAYSPPKFALRGLAEVLHMELRPFNIHVSMCNPPDVDTPGLAEEMKFKPQECKLISEGIGLFTAQHIAGDIIASLKKWQFFVHSGFEGQLSKHLSAAMSPPSSVLDSVIQFFFAGPLRLIGLGYIYSYYSIVDKVYRQEKLVK